jgi:N-acetylneuraminic acid mutarotase
LSFYQQKMATPTFACKSFLNNKTWTHCEDAPKELRRSADAVTNGNKVYIRRSHVKEILVFDLDQKVWDQTTNLQCDYYRSSLVIMNDQLIAVGGTVNQGDGSLCEKDLILISSEGNKPWTKMKQPRSRCTSIACQYDGKNLLIIAGGEHPVGNTLKTVEILQVTTTSKISKIVCPLPEMLYSCSAAVVKDHLYLLGGWNERQKASNKLFSCPIKSLYEGNDNVWQTPPVELPAAQTTCVAFRDQVQLLTIGGTWCSCYDCKCSKPTKNIYEYNEKTCKFECIGSTPAAQYLCLACATDNTIFIAGGAINEDEALTDAYILKY